jgi:capsid protein
MGWIEFHRNIGHWRWNIMIPQFLEPVSRRLAAAVQMAGMVNRVNGRMIWTPPRREMINPSEEIKALVIAIRAGILSLSEVQRSLGYVPQQVLAELAKDLKDAREVHKLVLTVDASQTNDSGGLQVSNTPQPTAPPASETSDLIT